MHAPERLVLLGREEGRELMLWCYCPAEHDWVPDGWCEDICCEMCDESVKCWADDEGEEVTDER